MNTPCRFLLWFCFFGFVAAAQAADRVALAETLALPGREIDQIFKETGRRVIEATEKRQQPWVNSSFYDSFVVRPGDATAAPGVPMTVAANATAPAGAQSAAPAGALRPFELPLERGLRAAADEIEITPGVISVGKWPEGLALIGDTLWVAESGQRSLGQFETATGELIQRVTCGRLPVSIATLGDTLYATVNTDSKIWRQPLAGKGGDFAATGSDYPEALAADGSALYALLWLDGSSADSVVARIDAATGKMTRSASLGANAADLIVAGGNVWVINNFLENDVDNATLTRLDPTSLKVLESIPIGGRQMKLAAAGDLLFVSGGWDELGSLMSYDAATGEPVGFAEYNGTMVSAMGIAEKMAVSVDSNGVLYVHHRDTLAPQRTIRLGIEPFAPRDIIVTPEAIYLSVHLGDEEGVIYVINNWMPEGEVAEPVVTRLLEAESLGGVSLGQSEAEMREVLGEPEVIGDEFPNEYAGGFLVEASYASKGILVMLASEEKGGPRSVESVHLDGTSKLASAGGIRIGHSLDEVRLVYGEFEDKIEFPVPDPIEKEFTFVAGSIYGGVIIQFAEGKVSGIMLGAGAE
jgi:DNA-binding beta-propeller fold protein YncE